MRIAKTLTLSLLVTTSLLGTAFAAGATTGFAGDAIAPMPLNAALDRFAKDSGLQLLYVSTLADGIRTSGAPAGLTPRATLDTLLAGTGLQSKFINASTVTITKAPQVQPLQLAQAAPRTAVETVTVTSSKLGGADVQSIPIAITALSQEQLTATQTAGGPDLVKQVPNLTFTKTNFTGYSIQIRGIGTQAISVTTDPAVAVAFNDVPFIRNHFFEQEFYDVSSVEVLRGPQGTLYGRNATAGVVNLSSAKPTDQFEAMASGELGNYHQRRFEGMINLPIVDDRLDIRVAGEWTKRQGYSFNETTDQRIDGRDLWSGRVTIGLKPAENLQAYLIWEHFSEGDDRIRSAKQLCKTDFGPGEVLGTPFPVGPGVANALGFGDYLTQGCLPTSFYSSDAFQAPLGYALPYVTPLQTVGPTANEINPYTDVTQNPNLRMIKSTLDPIYKAKNDVVEFNADYAISPTLTLSSQTGFGQDFLYSAEDYNRFGAAPGFFHPLPNNLINPDPSGLHICVNNSIYGTCSGYPIGAPCSTDDFDCVPAGVFCDPQLGCSGSLLAEDLSEENAWQLSQEFRLASHFSGPLNFSAGGNYLHYETTEKYYVFINSLTALLAKTDDAHPWIPGISDNAYSLQSGFQYNDPSAPAHDGIFGTSYIDPNPISSLNDNGHNYFLSKNPYVLNSYAAFGEVNYNLASDLKLIGGVRWTEDQKHFVVVPSWLATAGWGYPVAGTIDQRWSEVTGRTVVNWTPKLDFTDQTLVYGSFAHGYKAGGANPPGAKLLSQGDQPTHPLTFKPEFINSYELGTKNTLLDGALTLNGDFFFYDYKNYQISEIVDRTAINLNFDAHAKGAEVEATWEPVPGLRFNFAGGWEDTAIADGESAVDLMDRTAGHPGWLVEKPFVTEASNCIFPDYVVGAGAVGSPSIGGDSRSYCSFAYIDHLDPVTLLPYIDHPSVRCDTVPTGSGSICPPDLTRPLPTEPGPDVNPNLVNYAGFDPTTAPNGGAGFSKDLSGNQLPNAPPFTLSAGAQYSIPITSDWAATLRGDFYWQSDSYWRVFNDLDYDKLHGYKNLNLTLILTSQSGWQVMLYDKNVFNTTAITGAFLNSDDSGLTTNVFLTDPKLIGVRVTKNW